MNCEIKTKFATNLNLFAIGAVVLQEPNLKHRGFKGCGT